MKNRSCESSEPTIDAEEAFRLIKEKFPGTQATVSDCMYCSWPQTFGSAAGPFGGIGGSAITRFRMEAWEIDGFAVVFCCGKIVKVGKFSIQANYR